MLQDYQGGADSVYFLSLRSKDSSSSSGLSVALSSAPTFSVAPFSVSFSAASSSSSVFPAASASSTSPPSSTFGISSSQVTLSLPAIPPSSAFPSSVQSSSVGGSSGQVKMQFRQNLASGVSCSNPLGMLNPLLPHQAGIPVVSGISQGLPVASGSGLRSAVLTGLAVLSLSGLRLASPAFSAADPPRVASTSFILPPFSSSSSVPPQAVWFVHPPPGFSNVSSAPLTRLPFGNNVGSALGFSVPPSLPLGGINNVNSAPEQDSHPEVQEILADLECPLASSNNYRRMLEESQRTGQFVKSLSSGIGGRVDFGSGSSMSGSPEVASNCGLIHDKIKPSSYGLFLTSGGPHVDRHRCDVKKLESHVDICFSSVQSHSSGNQEIAGECQDIYDCNSSLLAPTPLVSGTLRAPHGSSGVLTHVEKSSQTAAFSPLSSKPSRGEPSCMATVERAARQAGLYKAVARQLSFSLRKSTHKLYQMGYPEGQRLCTLLHSHPYMRGSE
ncbi:uncharacterized protein [Macrobrachium rosenbergii]|uniref:uncharacterized protein n=1 Tax=Macrobrachium rosenbergii TaxID=79674 RepID=UPI0034D4B881